jgi:MIP family channel proteins
MPKLSALIGEFAGTLILVLVVSLAAISNSLAGPAFTGQALANGLVVGIVVTGLLPLSGGQINPAITIGLAVMGKQKFSEALVYMVAQVLGAATAGYLLQQLVPQELAEPSKFGTPTIHPGLETWQGLSLEAVATAMLAFSVCATVLHPKTPHNNGLGIGATVAFLVYVFGPLTGAAMNPARQLGSAFAAGYWADHWLYWVGGIIGATVGLLVFDKILKGSVEEEK